MSSRHPHLLSSSLCAFPCASVLPLSPPFSSLLPPQKLNRPLLRLLPASSVPALLALPPTSPSLLTSLKRLNAPMRSSAEALGRLRRERTSRREEWRLVSSCEAGEEEVSGGGLEEEGEVGVGGRRSTRLFCVSTCIQKGRERWRKEGMGLYM